ncbi:aminoacyl-tRNA hydrolase [Brevibacterium sp. UMB1308A]|uniref:aminoacyl-tRNA hydrolase n=1 Tax=Brevibacterium sp. UMB1308A TaxID=3050608 RepID=UPI00255168F0|nr:aminoacyl-tRNA hydrolase [Brevibacterium sp. UMB1308A]MDK8345862.1 aminoacyl-tRNA hydrolase [Brevibacterium sp. UMB1308B]MDK8712858.1 aminoacyl-tRNA hydrolase [Brevibacterium sp. UMB1308A]
MRYLIIGLGNPGPRYANTRHNIGHMVLDELARRCGATLVSTKTRALAASVGDLGGVVGTKAVLMKSATYMNDSGIPVRQLADFYSIDPDHVIAIHDDVDLPFDSIKLKLGGGEGGHNGLRSMSKHLGTRDYLRVRAGVGRPPGRMDTADYVLQNFSSAERKDLPIFVSDCADAVEDLVLKGLTEAQQRYHSRQN